MPLRPLWIWITAAAVAGAATGCGAAEYVAYSPAEPSVPAPDRGAVAIAHEPPPTGEDHATRMPEDPAPAERDVDPHAGANAKQAIGEVELDAGPTERRFQGPVVPRDQARIVVLQYHDFGHGTSPLVLPVAAFERHLEWLVRERIDVIRLRDLVAFVQGDLELPARTALITLDDGQISAKRTAFPLLAKRNMPFTIAISPSFLELGVDKQVSWSDVREMLESGLCEVASHGHRHEDLARLDATKAYYELVESRRIIEERTGVVPDVFVYPFGSSSRLVDSLAEKAGYRVAMTAWGFAARHDSPRYRIPRVGMSADLTMDAIAHLWKP